MNDEEGDLALQTLINVRADIAPHLDEALLRECYAIQKKYQFSEDRSMSSSAMERLIDAAVKTASGEA